MGRTGQGTQSTSGDSGDGTGSLSAHQTAAAATAAAAAAATASEEKEQGLKKSCDFCIKRKRPCDGMRLRRCSFCIAKKQPTCHYSFRSPLPPRASTKAVSSGGTATLASKASTAPSLPFGRSFGRTGGENAEKRGRRRTSAKPKKLPLKRSRMGASPATGLIGLEENDYLRDFYACMGFLSLASESVVRGAMMSIMLADQLQPAQAAQTKLPAHVEGQEHEGMLVEDGSQQATESGSQASGRWSEAVATGERALPRNASTCLLWCAIALGALVRGCPLSHVQQYVDLAQESLAACFDNVTLEAARAFIGMSFLHNFVENQAKNQECLKLATEIVDKLPPEELHAGLYEVLRYAKMSRLVSKVSASKEEENSYWEEAAPVWKLSDSVVEHDVLGLVISVDRWLDQPILDTNGVSRVVMPYEPVPVAAAAAAAAIPGPPAHKGQGAQQVGLAGLAGREVKPLAAIETAAERRKCFLPEMLRMGSCFNSSDLQLGIGGLLYYGKLSYMHLLDNDIPASHTSFDKFLNVMLRYPGLCRYPSWLHFAHLQLWALASTCSTLRDRRRYEELRATFNPVRPAGSPPAPPFDEFKGMSDICEHQYCSKITSGLESFVDIYRTI